MFLQYSGMHELCRHHGQQVRIMELAAADKGDSLTDTTRFFLGLLEAIVTPGLTLLTSIWYAQNEVPFRALIWYSFNGWAGILGGFVAYGVSSASLPRFALIDVNGRIGRSGTSRTHKLRCGNMFFSFSVRSASSVSARLPASRLLD